MHVRQVAQRYKTSEEKGLNWLESVDVDHCSEMCRKTWSGSGRYHPHAYSQKSLPMLFYQRRCKDMVFAGEAEMSITEFLEETIALRGSNPATVRDLGQLKLQKPGLTRAPMGICCLLRRVPQLRILREMRARGRPMPMSR